MLTFFRRIRKRLFQSGQTRKYLLYSIGEIALVVIGILIALQINNWNQTKSEDRIAHDYKTALITELNSDLEYFQQLNARNKEQKSYIDEILIALNSDKTPSTDEQMTLMWKLSESMDPSDFFPKKATYQDLIASGKMAFIKPINFRQKIITHYNLMEQKSLHINRELDYSWNHLIPLLNDKGFFEWRNFSSISLDTIIVSKTTRLSILDLDNSSKEFEAIENNLFFAKLMLTSRIQNLDELIESTNKLISEIEKHSMSNKN